MPRRCCRHALLYRNITSHHAMHPCRVPGNPTASDFIEKCGSENTCLLVVCKLTLIESSLFILFYLFSYLHVPHRRLKECYSADCDSVVDGNREIF